VSEHPDNGHGLRRREFLQRGAAAGAALALPGFASQSALAAVGETPKRGGKLIVGFVGGGDKETLDPHLALADIDFARGLNLFDRLTHFMPDLSVKPLLAESLEPNSKGTLWQIKLRSGVTWHDGKPFTADDVLYTYRRIIGKKLIGASRLSSLDMARAKKVNDLTITLPLKSPFADLPAMLAEVWLSIVQNGATKFTNPVGTGPFKFTSWSPSRQSVFSKNENYFASGKPYLDQLQMVSIEDNTARLNALLNGQIHALVNLDFVQAKAHKNDKSLNLIVAKAPFTVPIYMRLDREPFKDKRVRQALRLVVDREQLVENVLSGFGTVGNDLFGKGTPNYASSLPQRPHDPEKAKSLLKQAGHDGLNLTLYTSSAAPGMLESATAFAQQAKAANVNIKLIKTPADTYYSGQYYLKVAMGQTNYQGIIPVTWADALRSDGPFNETVWKRPSFDKGFAKAEATVDPAKRKQIFFDLQKEQYDEGGYIIWGFNNTIDATNPKVKGVKPSNYYYLGGVDFKSYWLS
jgi:peptide/nickel transport system substrate-binding protein